MQCSWKFVPTKFEHGAGLGHEIPENLRSHREQTLEVTIKQHEPTSFSGPTFLTPRSMSGASRDGRHGAAGLPLIDSHTAARNNEKIAPEYGYGGESGARNGRLSFCWRPIAFKRRRAMSWEPEADVRRREANQLPEGCDSGCSGMLERAWVVALRGQGCGSEYNPSSVCVGLKYLSINIILAPAYRCPGGHVTATAMAHGAATRSCALV